MKKLFIAMMFLAGALCTWAQTVVIDHVRYVVNSENVGDYFWDSSWYDPDETGNTAFAAGWETDWNGEHLDPTSISFPESVNIEGVDYTVTRIWPWSWGSTLKSIFIPKTIRQDTPFWESTNIEQIVIDAENPLYDSRDNCNGIIRTADNVLLRASNNFVGPSSVSVVGSGAFGYCTTVNISKYITEFQDFVPNSGDPRGILSNATSLNVDEENPRYYSPENSLCLMEKGTDKLLTTSPFATIPDNVASFGEYSLVNLPAGTVINYSSEFPAPLTVDLTMGSNYCILKVPEGTIPRYIYQGWGDKFKAITDDTYTYYGRPDGDTWFAPHIETVNFPADKAGEEVTLSVVLNADRPVTAFQFDLYLPDGMEMTFDEDDFENILLSTARTTERKHTLTSQQMPDGAWRVICYSDKNNTFEGGEGEVCTITVKTNASMANGSYPIVFKNMTTTYITEGEGTGQETRDQITTYVNFFTPESPLYGDANGDGTVNVTDITTIVSYILGNNPTKFVFSMADAYTDGAINVTDIAATVGIIMNESSPQPAPRRNARRTAGEQGTGATTARLEVIPFAIAPGEEKEVEVVLFNPDDAFTGMQFDLTLPEGISLVSDEDGYFVSLGSRTTSRKHTIEAQLQADGTIRVMAYSNRNSNFSGSEGDVAILTLKADDQLKAGVYDVQLHNIILSQANGGDIDQQEPADYEGSILSGTLAENPVIKGDITAEAANIISAAVTKDVTHIDLTSATKVADDAVFTTANPNTLILAAAGTQNASKNVVAGDVCANLVLSDASAFAAPKTFTASQVSFSTNVNDYKTLTLPFNADVPEGFSASNATSVTGTTVNLESTSTINANSPVMIEGEGPLELKAANAVVKATGDAAFTNGMLSGTFKSIPAPVGSYVLQKHSGTTGFYLVADVQPTVGAFRAILNVPETGVKLYTFDDEATGISLTPALSEEGATYYNVSGQRLSRMQKGINIVNGKKILY